MRLIHSRHFRKLVLYLQENNLFIDLSLYRYTITKTYLYNVDPLKPHFYIVKLGFIGVYIIFLISAKKTQIVGIR